MHELDVKGNLSAFKCMNYLNAYIYSTAPKYVQYLENAAGDFQLQNK